MSTKTIYCLLFVLALAGRLEAEDGPVEPYVAYVAREGEFARCGPSEEYYKTDPLRAGAEVEVYLETEDGWLGIRPPDDSFCWLQSDQVEVADDETQGTIVEPSTVAWIGTHLGKARQYRWQVRLDQGEQVTIIGTARREGPEGEEVWYRIVPPPGEFRWVQRSQVSDSLDKVVYGNPADDSRPDSRYAADRDRSASPKAPRPSTASVGKSDGKSGGKRAVERADVMPAEDSVASLMEDAPVGSGLARIDDDVQIRSIAENDSPASRGRPGPPTELPTQPIAEQHPEWVSGSRVVTASATGAAAAPLQPTAPPRLQPLPAPVSLAPSGYRPSADLDIQDLDSLRLELSHVMAAGAHADEVEPLRGHVARLATEASESVIRGRASLLLRRIEEYQRVAQQRDGRGTTAAASPTIPSTAMRADAAALGPQNPATGNRLAPGAAGQTVPGQTVPGQTMTFDGQGWLVRVYSARPDAPPYAITDSAGRTLSYITPSAGINLRRYLNQEVGLYGRVAYDTSLETPHLIAEQAVRLRTR